LLLTALAIGIRAFNNLALDPFGDEVTWLRWAVDFYDPQQPITLWTTLREEGRPPLFYWLTLLLLPMDSNAFLGGRMAAAIASGAAAGVLYVAGRQLFSRTVGLVAAMLWALLPFGVLFGRLASSDDSLLALSFGLVMITAVPAARRPSVLTGILCGLCVAMAIFSKTLGVLALLIPACAMITLTTRQLIKRLPLSTLGIALGMLIGLAPLAPWAPSLLKTANFYADTQVQQESGSGPKRDTAYRLEKNFNDTREYLSAYVGAPVLLLAAGLAALMGLRKRRELIFLSLLLIVSILPVLVLTVVLYSRYLLGFALPVYLLGAAGFVYLGQLIVSHASRIPWVVTRKSFTGAAITGGVATLLWPQLALSWSLLTDPGAAVLPTTDRWRYFEHRWSLNGLSEHAAVLKAAASNGPIAVVQPRGWEEWRFTLPYNALRFELRNTPNIAFRTVMPARSTQPATREQPTSRRTFYLISNEPDLGGAVSGGRAFAVPRAVNRNLPSVSVASKTVRPGTGYSLTLYRASPGSHAFNPLDIAPSAEDGE
jgi:4-amino-4-deoxy-L-arabinose transferase-like glycosyltransferase